MMQAADQGRLDDPAFVKALHPSWLRGVLRQGEVCAGPVVDLRHRVYRCCVYLIEQATRIWYDQILTAMLLAASRESPFRTVRG
jgi:hypothetical protein